MKYCIPFLILNVLLSASSCSKNSHTTEYILLGLPYEDNDANTYGIIDSKGDIVVSGFEDATSPIINGYFVKETEDGAHVLCKVEGNAYSVISNSSG